MNPNEIMLAENMAIHFQNTLRDMRRVKGVHGRDWKTLTKDQKQELIQVFQVILGQSDDAARDANLKLNNPLKKPI